VAEQLAGFCLSDDEIVLAAVLVRAGAAAIESRNGSMPAAAARLRDQLAMFARRIQLAQASAAGEHANLPGCPDGAASGARISVAAAARMAGFTPQHIRRLCHRGDLAAVRAPSGHWLIEAWSAGILAARREER
jgi:hypothetical protein